MIAWKSIGCCGRQEAANRIPLREKPQEPTRAGAQPAPGPSGKPILEVGMRFFDPESVDPKPCHFPGQSSSHQHLYFPVVEADNEVLVQAHATALQREFFCPFFNFIYLFLEKGREGEREGEKHQCVSSCLTYPQLGTQPTSQACALHQESNQ